MLRRFGTKERDLVVGLHVDRIPSVDIVPTPNSEIGSTMQWRYTNGSSFEECQL